MYIPSAHSKISVIILLIIAVGLFLWVHNSRVWVKENIMKKNYKLQNSQKWQPMQSESIELNKVILLMN